MWSDVALIDPYGGGRVYITSYRYIGEGPIYDFTVPHWHNYCAGGLVNHNSGKSLCAFVEDARAVTGTDPYKKYPEKDGHLIIVGQNWPHIGLTIYPMLFKPGAFRIIKDLQTGEWRAWRPQDPEEAKRKKETKPAPALIPKRFIVPKGMSYRNRKERWISSVQLETGWTMHFFSSDGEIPQGFKANRIHFDEDVQHPEWVGEMQARIADHGGNLHWSAMPHAHNDALLIEIDRGETQAEEGREKPDVVVFRVGFLDNPYIGDEEKRKAVESWTAQGEDVLNMRLRGEVGKSVLMYPTFQPQVHTVRRVELPDGEVPRDWCRYMVVDPGYEVCGVLFAAVSPDDKRIIVEDELWIRQCTASKFAEAVLPKTRGKWFYSFIIDAHGGALRDIGGGRSVKPQYVEELARLGIECELTHSYFVDGCDDIPLRTNAVREALHTRPDGTRRLMVLEGACPNLERTMRRYKRKTISIGGQTVITDKPESRGNVHLCQCLEYLMARDPEYHRPKIVPNMRMTISKYLASKRKGKDGDASFIYCGPQSDIRKN